MATKSTFNTKNFDTLAKHLQMQKVAVTPTDTIPGFTVDARFGNALAEITRLKRRPPEKPFVLLAENMNMVESFAECSRLAKHFAKIFWPGPLTMLLPRKENTLPDFFPNAPEFAFRVPGNSSLLQFLQLYQHPLTSTSVNFSGESPLTDFAAIFDRYRQEDIAVFSQDEATNQTIEDMASTIVRVNGDSWGLVRQGCIPENKIKDAQLKI